LIAILVSTTMRADPSDCVVSFLIDFGTCPPTWQSDDEEFWRDVKTFFVH